MNRLLSISLLGCVAFCTSSVRANTVYVLMSPGHGLNYIEFASNSSASGGLSDIVSMNLLMPWSQAIPGPQTMSLSGTFSWDATQIASMNLSFSTPEEVIDGGFRGVTGWTDVSLTENGLHYFGHMRYPDGPEPAFDASLLDLSGTWQAFASVDAYLASVPDGGNTALLLLAGIGALAVAVRRFKTQPSSC